MGGIHPWPGRLETNGLNLSLKSPQKSDDTVTQLQGYEKTYFPIRIHRFFHPTPLQVICCLL
jgi:hypothetical protein